MSAVFERYADCYDIYYRAKDYVAEAAYVTSLLGRHAAAPIASVLDLGCGTGGHCLPWARSGLKVMGVDRSETMLAQARKKASEAGLAISLQLADIRSLDLGERFDAVASMFNVMGYQASNEALYGALASARRHLEVGGLFVFDGWYGPVVLTTKPEQRQTSFQVGDGVLTRKVVPELDAYDHLVRVNFSVQREERGAVVEQFDECHVVRFFFPQELRFFLTQTGFELVAMHPFMRTVGTPQLDDWNFTLVARAVARAH